MLKEITSNVETNNTSEEEVPSLRRIRAEEAAADKDSRILGMDYPSGIMLAD